MTSPTVHDLPPRRPMTKAEWAILALLIIVYLTGSLATRADRLNESASPVGWLEQSETQPTP